MNQIMLALSEAGCLVWRNETALAWAGRVVHREAGIVTISGASAIACGLCVGSADLIGIAPGGRFLAIEVKTSTGRPSKEQTRFIAAVARAGGVAGIARSVDEALSFLA